MELRSSVNAMEGVKGRWTYKLYRDMERSFIVYAEAKDGKNTDILFHTYETLKEAKEFIKGLEGR